MQPNTKCKVCGKEYYCCVDSRKFGGFRTVACSPECFQEYMRQIEKARKPVVETVIEDTTSIKKKTNKTVEKTATTTDSKTENNIVIDEN